LDRAPVVAWAVDFGPRATIGLAGDFIYETLFRRENAMGRIKTLLAASLAVFALLGAGKSAKASLALTIEVFDSSNVSLGTATATMDTVTQSITSFSGPGIFFVGLTSQPGDSELDYAGVLGGVAFSFTVGAGSNSPGSSQLGSLSIGYNAISNPVITGADRKFSITAIDTGFTSPQSPPSVIYSTSTSGTLGGVGTSPSGTLSNGSFTSTADGNAANPILFGSPPISGTTVSIGVNGTPKLIDINSSPFTFSVNYTATLAAGSRLTTGGGLATLSAVPEPASLAMMFSALPMAGLAAWRRRRAKA